MRGENKRHEIVPFAAYFESRRQTHAEKPGNYGLSVGGAEVS